MFSISPKRSDDALVFWMELIDHDAGMSLDSCSFREIDDALSAFDELVARARS